MQSFESWLEVEEKVAVKHRQHVIAASFISQQEYTVAEDIDQLEASRPQSRSGAQVAESGSKKKVLHTHSYGSQEKARTLERVRGCTRCTSWKSGYHARTARPGNGSR